MEKKTEMLVTIALLVVSGIIFNLVSSPWIALAIVSVKWTAFFYLVHQLETKRTKLPEMTGTA